MTDATPGEVLHHRHNPFDDPKPKTSKGLIITVAVSVVVHVLLGIFNDPLQAVTVADSFAMLGAVDEETLDLGGNPATRLTLTHLKPGVARADVVSLARELGLSDPVL